MLVFLRYFLSFLGGNNSPGAESVRETPKSPKNVTCTFFNTVNLLQKEVRFEHGAPNLLLAPGAI